MAATKRRRAVPDKPRVKLVQTQVPYDLYERIEKCAKAETLSIAAYVRRTLVNVVPGG